MLNVAAEISQLVHGISALETAGVKIASVEDSALAQQTTAQASSALYNVITKCAQEFVLGEMPHHSRMVAFIDKAASVLGRPDIPEDYQLKIASAIAADDALTEVLGSEEDAQERSKMAEARAFGREFVMDLLKGVL